MKKIVGKARRIRKLLSALRHIPGRAIALRLRRQYRTRDLLARPDSLDRREPSSDEILTFATRLGQVDFVAAAERLREITATTFHYDSGDGTLIFLASGDRTRVDDIDAIDWTSPGGVAADDVNRCYFLSFVEQATLLDGAPVDALAQIDHWVKRLEEASPLGGRFLTIVWQPLAMARRLINLTAGLSRLIGADAGLVSHAAFSRLIKHIRITNDLVTWLREDDLGYNHLATEVFAQIVFAHAAGRDGDVERFSAAFRRVMDGQVGRDGMQLERSATYQSHLLGHVEVLIAGNFLPAAYHPWLRETADRMRAALAVLTHPDGDVAVFNDAAVGDGPSPAVLGVDVGAQSGAMGLLAEAGYARLEAGGTVAVFDAGPCGPDDNPGHAHADFLAIEVSIGKNRLFVDPGVSSYRAGPERDRCRSASEHNGPTFVGLEPIEFIGPFRVGRRGRADFLTIGDAELRGPGGMEISGLADGYQRFGGGVARWIRLESDGALYLVDAWRGLEAREARSSFVVPSVWTVNAIYDDRIELFFEDRRIVVRVLEGRMSMASEEVVHHMYGPKSNQPARRLYLHPREIGAGLRAATLIVSGENEASTMREFDFGMIQRSLFAALGVRGGLSEGAASVERGGFHREVYG